MTRLICHLCRETSHIMQLAEDDAFGVTDPANNEGQLGKPGSSCRLCGHQGVNE